MDASPVTDKLQIAETDDFEAMKNYKEEILVVGIVDGRCAWVPAVCTVHPRQRDPLYVGDRLVHTDGSMWTVTGVDWDRSKGGRWSGSPTTYTLRQDGTGTKASLTGAQMEDFWRPRPA